MKRAAVPALACSVILLALFWAEGLIPWIPVISETTGLAAVLFATGLAAEPALHGERWTWMERFGFSATVSAAFTVLAGVGLHLATIPVTTTNILSILLAIAALLGVASLPYRWHPDHLPTSRTGRTEASVALGSLVLLGAAIAAILLLRPTPNPTNLEAALIDDAGTLVALPLRVRPNSEVQLNVALRSPSGLQSPTSVSIGGDGVQAWSADGITPTDRWSVVAVPLHPLRPGTVNATVEIRNARTTLHLPLQIEVEP